MSIELSRRPNETKYEYQKRIILGKLVTKEFKDIDFHELSKYVFGKPISEDNARRMFYGAKVIIESKEEETEIDFEIDENLKKVEVSIEKDGCQTRSCLLVMSEEQAKNPEYLLRAHGYDVDSWELISARNNIWNVYSKQDGINTLYSSKIVAKPKILTFSKEWIKEVMEELGIPSPKVEKTTTYNPQGKTLEINLADVHIDKLCCLDETRNEYSTEIGIQRLWQVIYDIIEKTKAYEIKRILFPFGQDVSNIDNMFNTTTKGTPQDTDVKYDVLYKKLLSNFIKIIETLSEIAPVEVIYVGGNHDKLTSFTMTEAMYWRFLNNEKVNVDSVFNNRKYRLIGDNLIGFAHGADEKKNIVYCMQNDVPDLWGQAKYREFHLSHFHKEKLIDEQNGIIFRWISAICGNDAWTYNSGYVGAQKKAQAFIWDDCCGLEAIINSYVK